MESKNITGLVYDLQRFAVHDGPGIRTLVYMKGCPLTCLWCSSPHTQKKAPEILHIETNCKKCGLCLEVCQTGAITFSEEEGPVIDRNLCNCDALCVEACPGRARELAGSPMTPTELFEEVDKDSAFYRRSNGGVTVGGGEPTMQHEFVKEFLKKCKKRYVHTVMETCGFAKWEHLEGLLDLCSFLGVQLERE
jgi:pyruvate formate lyase activating enzyme